MKSSQGFTLIESIIAMVIMGIAMITIASLIVPQVVRSADPYYQTRAVELGQSVMTKILSRGFADNSDVNGGQVRCGDDTTTCTQPLGRDGETSPSDFNDVDDYIGCWIPGASSSCSDLNQLTDDSRGVTFANFRVDISVVDDSQFSAQTIKRIEMTISAPNQSPITLRAFRGNY